MDNTVSGSNAVGITLGDPSTLSQKLEQKFLEFGVFHEVKYSTKVRLGSKEVDAKIELHYDGQLWFEVYVDDEKSFIVESELLDDRARFLESHYDNDDIVENVFEHVLDETGNEFDKRLRKEPDGSFAEQYKQNLEQIARYFRDKRRGKYDVS